MFSTLLSVLCCLQGLSAIPIRPRFARSLEKRQDWSAVKYDLSGVNWNTISYDLSKVDWKTVFPAAPSVTALAVAPPVVNVAQPSSMPVVVAAGNVVTVRSTKTTVVEASTPVAAGNIVILHSTTTAIVQATPTPQAIATDNKSGGKRGLGWDPTSSAASAKHFLSSSVSWYFNWSPTPSSGLPSSWEFYANIWGSGGIESLADKLHGRPKLIGFNEPDSASQANLKVADAIALYKQYLVPLKGAGKISQLGTPAVTNSGNPGEGLNWLAPFVTGCKDCGLDFAVVHWYAESIDDFKNHVTRAHQMTGLPINVAEFAYTSWNAANEPSEARVLAFMLEAISWLDAQDFVVAYAWFGSMYVSEAKYPSLGSANSLIGADLSSLTTLGMAY